MIMGSPGLLRAARNKLIAVERSKEEVMLLVIVLAMLNQCLFSKYSIAKMLSTKEKQNHSDKNLSPQKRH